MIRAVVVTYYWPPAGGPGVQRWLKFATYLASFGIEPLVVVPENPSYPSSDSSLTDEVRQDIEVVKVPIREPYALAKLVSKKNTRDLSKGIIKKENVTLLQQVLLYIRGNFFIPDARKSWVKPVVKVVANLMERDKIDMVITTGPPHSVHLIGQTLKRKTGIKWVADFRDPWTTIGYHKDLKLGKKAQKRHISLERQVLHEADQILVTSFSTRNEFAAKTRTPIAVITNGYDGNVAQGAQPEGKFVIAHIGSLLSGRNPVKLWEVLSELVDEETGFKEDLNLQLIGNVSEDVLNSVASAGLAPYLTHSGYVSHSRAIELQREAQVLLLLEINSPETAAIIPGKLFEYFAAKRPILAIGPENWDAALLIGEHRAGKAFTYGDGNGLKRQLSTWYRAYKKKELISGATGIEQYSRKERTALLAKILKTLP